MDIMSLLLQAANLMLTGMVGVFVFLSILIFAVKSLEKLSDPQLPEEVATRTPKKSFSGVSNAHIAAITAAIAQYRTKK
ncbi:OadG family protein [Pseudoalteromonas byunsanensis]|uniref:Probable oxaloacetate decarboxylase gamma chain n=1 Tax=Pseudoalteromonas byunsanensis TaxID=327939 RepID=A0A1S1NA93_9GAMM|nr:OadG family transporter subunit [Pseudoalteromonas byunsanensis]OHU95613.1 oxaloacetate decarboxylase [Pseudoalteromonas byunsanensis]